jgi:hypothetical protein
MIARLHAMYQGSRMMLIFLVVIFLVVNIVCAVIMAIVLEHSVGGKLYLRLEKNHTAHWTNIRGADSLWSVYVRFSIWRGCPASDWNDLGVQLWLASPHTVSFNLGCCEILLQLPTTRPIDRINHQGLFQSADKISCALFCKVSL